MKLIFLALFLCLCSGCAVLPPTHYVKQDTPYYKDAAPFYPIGTEDSKPPDGWLAAGSKVWEIDTDRKSGWSQVWIEFASAAYVYSRDLTPAEEYEKKSAGH